MTGQKYNGWVNYETWKLNLNLTNEEGIYLDIKEKVKEGISEDDLKEYLEELYKFNEVGYKIIDFWSYNEWNEIYFNDIIDSFKED